MLQELLRCRELCLVWKLFKSFELKRFFAFDDSKDPNQTFDDRRLELVYFLALNF